MPSQLFSGSEDSVPKGHPERTLVALKSVISIAAPGPSVASVKRGVRRSVDGGGLSLLKAKAAT